MLGKFKLIAELGRGGMSEVYLAVVAGPAGFNKLVVIKLIKAELAEDPDFINMFLEEARLSARLSHPNVVQTNEVGEVGGRYYIAMEYLEGQPYSRILHRLGRDRGLPLGMSLRILSDVLQGLHYAHELPDFDGSPLGVVHRDVTPHNVFVTYDGQVKVVDFGIAKAMNSSHETRTGMLKGKVGYMAPEQAKGERVDRRADIFSVGVMLWEAAVGRRLWKGLNEVQILHQLLSGEIPSPRSMRPDISTQLEALIMKTLASDRDKRHSTTAELQAELDELMDAGSERSTLREVGRLLSGTFDEERKKLKTIIEQQVARTAMVATGMYQQMAIPQVDQPAHTHELPRASFGPAVSNVPQMASFPGTATGPHYMSASGSHSVSSVLSNSGSNPNSHSGHSHPGHSSYAAGSGSHPGSHPSHPSAPGSHPSGPYSHPGGSHPGMPLGSIAGPASGALPKLGPLGDPEHSSQPSVSSSLAHLSVSHSPNSTTGRGQGDHSNKKLTMVALGIAAAAGGLAALLYVGLGRSAAPPTSTAATTTTGPVAATEAPSTSSANPPPSSVVQAPSGSVQPIVADAKEAKIEVKVKPDNADIFLDDKKIGTGKVSLTLAHDGSVHELKVDAPGYSSKARKIQPHETTVDWKPELFADRGSHRNVRVPPPPPPAETGAAPVVRDKNGKIIRGIDKTYPGG